MDNEELDTMQKTAATIFVMIVLGLALIGILSLLQNLL